MIALVVGFKGFSFHPFGNIIDSYQNMHVFNMMFFDFHPFGNIMEYKNSIKINGWNHHMKDKRERSKKVKITCHF